jgi:hypothetical protein
MKGNKFSAIQLRAMEAAGLDVPTLSEKKKGLDGKVCWKGYKLDGTKQKGGKTVDNCVKEEETLTEKERVIRSLAGEIETEGFIPIDREKQQKIDRQIGRAADKESIEQSKSKKYGRDEKKIEKQYQRQQAMRFGKKMKKEEVELEEQRAKVRQNGNIYIVGFTWMGKYMVMKLFFPEVTKPSRREAEVALQKIYPGARMQRFDQAPYNPSEPMLYMGVQENEEVEYVEEKKDKDTPDQVKAVIAFDKARKGTDDATYDSEHGEKKKAKKERDYAKWQRDKGQEDAQKSGHRWKHAKGSTREKEGKKSEKDKYIKDSYETDEKKNLTEKSAAWQRKEGKNKKGGLNEKGRKSYERENPGSDLKAPQPEGGPRKRSFCARMGGVKGPMKKPNGEPTRKALALRKWKC